MLYARSDNDLANMVGCLVVELAAVGCNPNTSKLLWSDLYDLWYFSQVTEGRPPGQWRHSTMQLPKKNNSNTSKTKILTTENLKVPMFLLLVVKRWNCCMEGEKNVGKHPSGDLRKKAIVDMQHRSQIGYMKFNEHMGTLLNRHLSLRLRLKFLILSSLLQFWLVFMMCPLTSN